MLDQLMQDTETRMDKAMDALRREFASVRAGRATPSLLDKISVDYYGTPTPISQVGNISCPEPRLLVIQPWDKSTLALIEKAIQKSDLGLNPNNDGIVIRIAIPQLTEDRRKDLVKTCHKKAEESKVILRNIRRDVNDEVKALEKKKEISEDDSKRFIENIQKSTDKYIKKADEILSLKEKDILEI